MKKLLALSLALLMVFALVACGGSAADKVAKYVDQNEEELVSGLEQGFETSGMACSASVEAKDCGIIINLNINMFDNIDEATKAQLQAAYEQEAGKAQFEQAFDTLKEELPELEYYQVNLCEKDGDLLVEIVVGDK